MILYFLSENFKFGERAGGCVDVGHYSMSFLGIFMHIAACIHSYIPESSN